VAAWSLTQCAPPDSVLFPLNPNSPYKNGVFFYGAQGSGGAVMLSSDESPRAGFFNVDSDGGRGRGGRGGPGFAPPPAPAMSPTLASVNPALGRFFNVAADAPRPVIMAVKGDLAFIESAEKEDGDYPDGAFGAGLPVAFYNHGAAGAEQYAEMKLFSPLKLLRSGQTLTHVVTWKIAPLGEARGALTSAAK
jgi:hypothetical protein